MAAEFPEIVIRNHDDLVDAFAAVKNHLGLSDALCEELAGMTRGHISKIFGRQNRIGAWLLGILCELFAVELVVRVNPEALKRMQARYEQRDHRQVRAPHTFSRALLDKCRPFVLAELGLVGEQPSKLNGHSRNGHAATNDR